MMVDELHFSIDDAFSFACRLRGHPAGMNDSILPDERSDPTWQVKVYDGGCRLPLGGALPWWMQTSAAREEGNQMLRLGSLLFDAVGVSRVRWNLGGAVLSSPQHPELVWRGAQLSARRPVPSGGAMYPTEVYVAAVASASPVGASVFHYDPARHELTDLAHPCPATALRAALGLGHDAPLSPLALILTHRFCKNLYKYRNFAYRLGAVDVGVVLGRLFAYGLRSFGRAEVYVDFDDAALNAMCGLDGEGESAYAVILLGEPQSATHAAAELGLPSPPPVLERGHPARASNLFAAMHAAACRAPMPSSIREETTAPQTEGLTENDLLPHKEAVPLPAPRSEITVERRELLCRTSNGAWFTGEPVGSDVLATVLCRTYEAIAEILKACPDASLPAVNMYCAVDNVAGVRAGWYRYAPDSHELVSVGAGQVASPAFELQQALYAATVDVERSAFSLHFATVVDFRSDRRGVRAYRVQQLFVGVAIDAATRWSTAMGAGSHPLHGFNAHRVDHFYGLTGTPFGVQAQVSIGNVRPTGILEGSVVI
jgi:SagB-type dehydrogenase family enzyme